MGRWTGSGISTPFGLRYKRWWAETNKSDGRWVNLYRGVVRERLNQQLWNLDNKSLKEYNMKIDNTFWKQVISGWAEYVKN